MQDFLYFCSKICKIMDKQELRKLIAIWFEEDIRDGDHTSLSCIPPTQMGCQQLIIKDTGVLAGVEVAKEIIHYFDPECRVEQFLHDGGGTIATTPHKQRDSSGYSFNE